MVVVQHGGFSKDVPCPDAPKKRSEKPLLLKKRSARIARKCGGTTGITRRPTIDRPSGRHSMAHLTCADSVPRSRMTTPLFYTPIFLGSLFIINPDRALPFSSPHSIAPLHASPLSVLSTTGVFLNGRRVHQEETRRGEPNENRRRQNFPHASARTRKKGRSIAPEPACPYNQTSAMTATAVPITARLTGHPVRA